MVQPVCHTCVVYQGEMHVLPLDLQASTNQIKMIAIDNICSNF